MRNLHAHNCRGIILSWSRLGQVGHSHVNNHGHGYVVKLFTELGYRHNVTLTSMLRLGTGDEASGMRPVPGWHVFGMLRETAFAFERITPLVGEGCTP